MSSTVAPGYLVAPWYMVLPVAAIFLAICVMNGRNRLQLPGPPGMPLLGNIMEFRAGYAEALDRWTRKYGDIFRISLGNRQVVVLSTRSAVAKTLIKQGKEFQSRPTFPIWHKVYANAADTNGALTLGTSPYGPNVTKIRKMLAPHTQAQRLSRYNHYFSRRYFRLVQMSADAVSRPCDLGLFLWLTTVGAGEDQFLGSIQDEGIIKHICETEIAIFKQRELGTPLHDWVPLLGVAEAMARIILSYSNSTFCAAEAEAERLRITQVTYAKKQIAVLHDRISNADETPSQLGDILRSFPNKLSEDEEYSLYSTVGPSGLTSGTLLNWLFGKLAGSPELQDKAYQAIYNIYGGQVPDPHDTDRVEYLCALRLESGRMWAPVPLGFPRATAEDTSVDGYFIPRNTIVVLNSHRINRDPAAYDSPDDFIPERWMSGHFGKSDSFDTIDDNIGVPHVTHGAGRRYCMGVPIVNKLIYGILALTLHFFKFERVTLDDEALAGVFPSFRASRQASKNMDSIKDRVSVHDAIAIPVAAGVRLIPRDVKQLSSWITEGHRALDQFDGFVSSAAQF